MRQRSIVLIVIACFSFVALASLVIVRLAPPTQIVTSVKISELEHKQFPDKLQFLWARYMDMVQLSITLMTGTIALSAGIVKFGQKDAVANRGYYASGMFFLIIGLIAAVLWRIFAQLLMEIEIFGNPETTHTLYQLSGVQHPFTSSYLYADRIDFYGIVATACMGTAAIGFLAGLSFLSLFAYSNLPELSRRAGGWRNS